MTTTVCTHPRAYTGLDGIYCPDCRATFDEKTRTYQQLVLRQQCKHEFRPTWLMDGTLVEYCSCGKSHPASVETIQTALANCIVVREDYLFGAEQAKPNSKQGFLDGVERLDGQIQWCREQMELLQNGMEPPEPTEPEPPEPDAPQPAEELEVAAVTVEVMETLAADEECDRQSLELRVERAFYEAGAALRELRDRRLYRSTHKTFEAYCRDRFGYQRAHSYRLIDCSAVVDNLSPIATPKMSPNGRQILPTAERQVRPLIPLSPNQQREVWQQAVEKAGGKVPSGQIVKRIVDGLREKPSRTSPANFCEVGDVFTLTGLTGEERHYNGCWAIAVGLNTFTVEVETHQETLLVKPDNLKIVDDPETRRQTPSTLKRIRRLRQFDLSNCARSVLETLGRQTYLTDKEEQMLHFLEQQYGIAAHAPIVPEALAAALTDMTPEQLHEIIEIAVCNGLDENQLKALLKTAKQALNVKHHPDYFAKS